ncbi:MULTISPECIES: hypothetical protein [Vibrio]|uniref:Uncharacterized protein n=1 Tax=Vibrio tasmaniensis TaxID=212663 RepID=A0A2N7NNE6_9VIBR|nr:hypothetical protein [Vibrio tasmaniensis]PMO80322.1 hypothetical protein BCT01_08505 [Vibrio tasmaniensis]PMP17810.1 hypothetical protein BCS92_05225 [Vibrio tasmaniensis]TKG29015.1 hypothetical protein FC057_20225 [Vibrio tasmaniensis]TKG41586.1 hypothetical protein FC063_06925 [Vibrio tasmaniensis]TKG46235.1 hypothetical protein FC070_22390 [Vibrio tasmaniensis]
MGTAQEEMNKLGFKPVEGNTYCDNTKYVGSVLMIPYPLFLLIVVQLFFVLIPASFAAYIFLVCIELLVWMLFKKMNIPILKAWFYYQERKRNKRRALTIRKQRIWTASTGFEQK